MNGYSPYSSKTTEQRLHEKHAVKGERASKKKEASWDKKEHRNMPNINKACIALVHISMSHNF